MIGMNLKYFREKYGYSQEELAERFDVSSQSVAKWESEETLPDVERCIKLAQLYDTTVEMLLCALFTRQILWVNLRQRQTVTGNIFSA